MIGHTGDFEAGIKCCGIIDKLLGKVVTAALKNNFISIITADHGNIEEMINLKTGEIDTKHSKNPVPFILVSNQSNIKNIKIKEKGKLANVAPTVLELMELPKPKEMKEQSLLYSKSTILAL